MKAESYIAKKCVNIHSGPDSKVMHSFTTCYVLFPIQCNDDGYFSSAPHLACKSKICQIPDSTNSVGDPYSAGTAYWSLIGQLD